MSTNSGSLGQTPKKAVNTDEYSFLLPDGSYTTPDIISEAIADGYSGGKSKIFQVQLVANPGSFSVGGITRTAGSGGELTRKANENEGVELIELDDFSTTVADGGCEIHLVLF